MRLSEFECIHYFVCLDYAASTPKGNFDCEGCPRLMPPTANPQKPTASRRQPKQGFCYQPESNGACTEIRLDPDDVRLWIAVDRDRTSLTEYTAKLNTLSNPQLAKRLRRIRNQIASALSSGAALHIPIIRKDLP